MTGLPRWMSLGVMAITTVLLYAMLTHGTFSPTFDQYEGGFADDFYLAQAQALIQHGHLWVLPAQIPSECWVHAGRCYGYFGLTPALMRAPFLGLLDHGDHSCAALFMTIALALGTGFSLLIAGRLLAAVRRTPLNLVLMAAVAISAGVGSVIFEIARPAVYEEAIAWSIGFAMVSIYCFLRWWEVERGWWAVGCAVAVILSANARPTTVALGGILGIGVLVKWLLARPFRLRPDMLGIALVVGLFPLLTCIAVYELKFHTAVPNSLLNQQIGGPQAAPWWVAIRKVDHNHLQGMKFLPTALVAFLRPDGIAFNHQFPYFTMRLGPMRGTTFIGIAPGSFFVEPFSTLPDDMPFAALVVIVGFAYSVGWRWRRLGLTGTFGELLRSPLTYCVLGAMGSVAVMLTQGVITNRYAADFYPVAVLSMIVAVREAIIPLTARFGASRQVIVAIVVSGLTLWSVAACLGFEYGSWWHLTLPSPG